MDDLPQECVEHIFSFLPIDDVFVCRSFEKWKEAADSIIRGQKVLTFFVVPDNGQTGEMDAIVLRQSEDPDQSHDTTTVTWTERLQGMV